MKILTVLVLLIGLTTSNETAKEERAVLNNLRDAGLSDTDIEELLDELYDDYYDDEESDDLVSARGGPRRYRIPTKRRRRRPNLLKVLASRLFSVGRKRKIRPTNYRPPKKTRYRPLKKKPAYKAPKQKKKPSYQKPKPSYEEPQKDDYGSPKAPPTSYNPPNNGNDEYGAPQSNVIKEIDDYGAPQAPVHVAPAPSYSAPTPSYKHTTSKPSYAAAPSTSYEPAPNSYPVNDEYGSPQAPVYNSSPPELGYDSTDPVEIEPAYEPDFHSYSYPATPDFSYDGKHDVSDFNAGDLFFATGFGDFPAFPMPTFPDLEPNFDENAFEGFKGPSNRNFKASMTPSHLSPAKAPSYSASDAESLSSFSSSVSSYSDSKPASVSSPLSRNNSAEGKPKLLYTPNQSSFQQSYSSALPTRSYSSPEPSYSPPAASYSYHEPDSNFTPEASVQDDESKKYEKRQATRFYVGKPDALKKPAGVPDIWDMFNHEWGTKL